MTQDLVADAYQEGYATAGLGRSFGNECPYTYNNFRDMSVQTFNEEKRALMNAWFAGWKKYQDERNLGFNFKPKGTR